MMLAPTMWMRFPDAYAGTNGAVGIEALTGGAPMRIRPRKTVAAWR